MPSQLQIEFEKINYALDFWYYAAEHPESATEMFRTYSDTVIGLFSKGLQFKSLAREHPELATEMFRTYSDTVIGLFSKGFQFKFLAREHPELAMEMFRTYSDTVIGLFSDGIQFKCFVQLMVQQLQTQAQSALVTAESLLETPVTALTGLEYENPEREDNPINIYANVVSVISEQLNFPDVREVAKEILHNEASSITRMVSDFAYSTFLRKTNPAADKQADLEIALGSTQANYANPNNHRTAKP